MNSDINMFVYTLFGILPSLIWLSFYLTQDQHPEPKRMILRVFVWGAIVSLPIALMEFGLKEILNQFDMDLFLYNFISFFVIVAPIEELFKYLVVKLKVINSPHLDEPVDIMLYMVVAALGFAGVENIIFMFSYGQPIADTLALSLIRFIGAVFVHTLCSGIIGYSLAISFCEIKWKKLIFTSGVLMAIVLHATFNFVMITLPDKISYPTVTFIIITSAFLIFAGFEHLKSMKGICKIR